MEQRRYVHRLLAGHGLIIGFGEHVFGELFLSHRLQSGQPLDYSVFRRYGTIIVNFP